MSFMAEGGTDICPVEHHDKIETMSSNAAEVASVPEVKSMEVESEETRGGDRTKFPDTGPTSPTYVRKLGCQPRSSGRTRGLHHRREGYESEANGR